MLLARVNSGAAGMSNDCLFCKIATKKIPAKVVYEDEDVFAFEDINPQAPVHLLVCPKKHFESLHHASGEDLMVVGKVAMIAAQLARERNLQSGYRTVMNTGAGAGQTVFHLHMHLLGGRTFGWPPG